MDSDKDEKSTIITLKWAYNDIRATHDNVKASMGLRAHVSSTNNTASVHPNANKYVMNTKKIAILVLTQDSNI